MLCANGVGALTKYPEHSWSRKMRSIPPFLGWKLSHCVTLQFACRQAAVHLSCLWGFRLVLGRSRRDALQFACRQAAVHLSCLWGSRLVLCRSRRDHLQFACRQAAVHLSCLGGFRLVLGRSRADDCRKRSVMSQCDKEM